MCSLSILKVLDVSQPFETDIAYGAILTQNNHLVACESEEIIVEGRWPILETEMEDSCMP